MIVRMLTELGVGGIHALNCERVSRMPDEERSLRIAAEALKQCRRTWLPMFRPCRTFPPWQVCRGSLSSGRAGCCRCYHWSLQPTTIVVGPEGGFTSDESACLSPGKTNAGSWAHLAYRNRCGCRGIVMGSRLVETAERTSTSS